MTWSTAAQWGHLEASLPGEWAAMLLTVTLIGAVGLLIMAVTFARHEWVVLRRRHPRQVRRP